jgi:hypothetical protein
MPVFKPCQIPQVPWDSPEMTGGHHIKPVSIALFKTVRLWGAP